MREKHRIFSLILVLLFAGLASCEKDKSDKDLLTSHPWDFVNATSESQDNDIVLAVAFVNLGFSGSTVEFFEGGDLEFTQPVGDTVMTGTWTLDDDGSVLTWTMDGEDMDFDVAKLDEVSMKLDLEAEESDGDPAVISLNWKK